MRVVDQRDKCISLMRSMLTALTLLARRGTQFTEGWVEFSKKSVAKIVAQTLNAQPIGFSSGGRSANKNARRWKDDVWTMKYLTGFKWHMLTEQMGEFVSFFRPPVK